LAKQLATKLGVDEAKMKTALDNAMQANRPSGQASGYPGGQGRPSGGGTPGTVPSGGSSNWQRGTGNTAMLTSIAKSIATELNLDQAKVLAALQEVWQSSGGPGGGNASGQPSAQPTQ
jgi:hypothetical protein